MFWFSQVFGHILMLLKNLSYLFLAFDLFGEMNFFSSQVHQFVYILFYIILSIYKKSECLETTVFLVYSTCFISPATFFFPLLNVKIALVLLHYFWFVQYAMLHKIIKCQHNKLAQYFHNF